MEAIILAGGLGTRLRDVVKDIPKPMAPVKEKPFLEYLLNWVLQYPVDTITLAVGYKAEVIEAYFGDNYNGIRLQYSREAEPLGTGGGIRLAMEATDDEDIIIINGDTYFPVDISQLYQFHQAAGSRITLALKQMEKFDRYGTVDLNGDTITAFNEKQYQDAGLINGGIYVVKRSVFEGLDLPRIFSFEKEILEVNAATGRLKGREFKETFIDIGIPADYQKATEIL